MVGRWGSGWATRPSNPALVRAAANECCPSFKADSTSPPCPPSILYTNHPWSGVVGGFKTDKGVLTRVPPGQGCGGGWNPVGGQGGGLASLCPTSIADCHFFAKENFRWLFVRSNKHSVVPSLRSLDGSLDGD